MSIQYQAFLISSAAVIGAIVILDYYHQDESPDYGDGGKATYVCFLLNVARPELFKEITGLERNTFNHLVTEFCEADLLEDGRSVTVEEQVLIFLDIVRYNNSMRQTAVKFQQGLYTVNHSTHDTSNWMKERHHSQVALAKIQSVILQNVLAAVNFHFEFVYVLAGWEGSAHDTRVFNDATSKGLNIPNKRFFLADAGYGLQPGLMTPYQAVQYHLKEQASAGLHPSTRKELYNLRHATLRNIVERLFECFKRKFSILKSAPEIELSKQIRLVYALCVLWNFLQKHETLESLLEENNNAEDTSEGPDDTNNPSAIYSASQEDARQKRRRDQLAKRLWTQYIQYTGCRVHSRNHN
ncbi:hypothetical protein PCASD_14270 [Puccinia coronata f. sp. avenae]|uniref:Uncharacterized protein n=1 Tax=Puccinia coronata f. sp. avenae TaxID=200324 RepID=A0A2N5TEZ1_9BASI|nr:hypothetical protein PCASD_14270 [Puccinia coronata f. sp. avenae]